MQETWVWSLDWKDPPEKGMAIHSSTLAQRIPWIEKPGGLQSMESQRIGHDWATKTFAFTSVWFIPIDELVSICIPQIPGRRRPHTWRKGFLCGSCCSLNNRDDAWSGYKGRMAEFQHKSSCWFGGNLEVFRVHSVSVWRNFDLQFLSDVLFCFTYLSLNVFCFCFFACDLMCVSFLLDNVCILYLASLVVQRVKHLPAMLETWVRS